MMPTFALVFVAAICVRGAIAAGELYAGDWCRMPEGGDGQCTLFHSCPSAQQAVRRREKPKMCAWDNFTPIVCCNDNPPTPAPHVPTTTPSPTRAPTTPSVPGYTPGGNAGSAADGAKAREKCQEYGKLIWRLQRPAVSTTPYVQLVNTSLCRVPQLVGGQPFVIGGKNASLFQFPHMGAVGFGESNKKRWLCGCALISLRHCLTAAHCVEDKSKPGRRGVGPARWVRLGDLNLYSDTDRAKVQDFSVVQRLTHPRYVDGVKDHDIGVLFLDRDVTCNEAVHPCCVHTNADPMPTTATATGWGAVSVDGHLAETLQEINLPLVSHEKCRPHFDPAIFPLYKPSLPSGILDSMLCAGGEPFGGRDTCQGDSGGPLQVLRQDPYCMYSLIGVTSFGKSCAKPDTPAVYTRVSSYVTWIESIVWP